MTEFLIEKKLYFRVTYVDPENCFPSIECFVFVGKNLSNEDCDDTWYFQPSRDYGLRGSILESKESDRSVVCVGVKDMGSMLDIEGLKEELAGAQCRSLERMRGQADIE